MNALISDSALRAVEQGILGLLLALGAACVGLFAWRWRAVGAGLPSMRAWRERLAGNLEKDLALGDGKAEADAGEAGAADRLMRLGLNNAHLCPEALEKLLETREIRERQMLERGAQFLGTVGANAPFLGLTGTVLGILSAFRRMASQGGTGGTEVMSAIAGALIATAVGLVVAIPAVVMYNVLKARIRRSMEGLGELRNLLLARSLQAATREIF
jgi:biopolymer transport protein ExbB/TolQ